MVGRHAAGEFVSAYRTFQRFPHHAFAELLAGDQVCVVVRYVGEQRLPPVAQEVVQGLVAVLHQLYLVALAPHHHAHQGDEDVQWRVYGVDDVGDVLELVVDRLQALAVGLELAVVGDEHQLHVAGQLVRVVRTPHLGGVRVPLIPSYSAALSALLFLILLEQERVVAFVLRHTSFVPAPMVCTQVGVVVDIMWRLDVIFFHWLYVPHPLAVVNDSPQASAGGNRHP